MPERQWRVVAKRLVGEALAWSLIPLGFLYVYIGHFGMPSAGAVPHLMVVALAWLLTLAARGFVGAFLGDSRLRHATDAALAGTFLGLLVIFYAAVLIGLSSWNRVPTWELITAYSSQGSHLLHTMEVPLTALAVGLLAFFALAGLAATLLTRRLDWLTPLGQALPAHRLIIVAILVACCVGLIGYRASISPPADQGEPVTLMFLPQYASRTFESHTTLFSARLDGTEQKAREQLSRGIGTDAPNVVLIVVDGLREDRSADPEIMPFLNGMVDRAPGSRIRNMRSVCAESACGLMAIGASRPMHLLPNTPITMQEVLMRHGYQVHMILGGDHTNFYGLRESYGPVHSYFDGSMQSRFYLNDDRLVLDALAKLPNSQKAPIFLQVHLQSVHVLGERWPNPSAPTPSENYFKLSRLPGAQLRTANLAGARNFYDNGARQVDLILERMIDLLMRKNLLNDAIFILTSDHGELLGEHDMLGHASFPWEESLRIPFVLLRFGAAQPALRTANMNSQLDIAPTILQEIGISPPSTWQGSPMQELESKRLIPIQQGRTVGVYDSRTDRELKYMRRSNAEAEWLFDLSSDPSEQRNLIGHSDDKLLNLYRREVAKILAADSPHGGGHASW